MKLLVVDDDRYTREGIIENFDWASQGFVKVMPAKDGDAALQLARWFKPDVIIADIRMPRMDGISFARKLLAVLPGSKIVFISGYIEVDYLRDAIDLSAVAFLEKPLDRIKLMDSVKRAVCQLKEVNLQQEKNIEGSLNRQRLAVMLNRNDGNRAEISRLCKEVRFPETKRYQCLALKVDTGEIDVYEAAQLVEQISERLKIPVLAEPREEGRLILVVSLKSNAASTDRLAQALIERLPGCSIGMGMVVAGLDEVCRSRKSAKSTLDLAYYDVSDRIHRYNDAHEEAKMANAVVYADFCDMIDHHLEALRGWSEQLCSEIEAERYRPAERVQGLIGTLLSELFQRNAELYGRFYGIGREEDVEEYIRTLARFEDLRIFLNEVITAIEEKQNVASQFSSTVREAKNYIASNYGDPLLSVQQVANHANFSPPYLNVVFKNEVGVTVKQYIIDYRMQQAVRLLRKGRCRIADIASQCGYSNANYFSKAFRESFGVPPGDYMGTIK